MKLRKLLPVVMALCAPALAQDRTEINGAITAGFKVIDNRGDLNYFRERVGERAGLTLESVQAGGISPKFRHVRLETLFTPENNSRVVIEAGSIENFRIRLKFDRLQTYYDTSSTNFAASTATFSPTPGRLFSLPGDLTLRRTTGTVDWSWNVRRRFLVRGGYWFRRSNGSDLQLIGGSYFSAIDSSLPTSNTLSTFHHAYHLGVDFPLGRFNFHVGGEIENLKSRDSFLQPQLEGIALNRDLTYRNETHGHYGSAAATFDFFAGSSWHFSGGYLFNGLRNNPQWSRLEMNRNFGSLTRRGDRLRADARFHGVFAQALYAPRRAVAVRYRVVQEWGEGAGGGFQQRFENPVDRSLTESLESRTSFDSTLHREQVSVSLYPHQRATLKATYRYDARTRTYTNFFTPAGLNFTAGASIQEGRQQADFHNLSFEGRLRATDRVQFQGGYGRRQNNIREKFDRLVRNYFLGDRDTETNLYRAGVKVRTTRRANFGFDFRKEDRDYAVLTSSVLPSQNRLEFNTYAATVNLHPASKWFLFGMLHYTSADTRLLGLARTPQFLTFSPWEYAVSNTGFLVGCSWTTFEKLTISTQFQQNRAGGTENYLLHDVAGSVEYELGERWSVGARYQFFESNLAQARLNNYHTHLLQGLLNYRF
ncbi:MAG: hypothetical protein HY238_05865 [Acidobacteria bacterium]|nr:hypothetical protein [Acidobacteriota bacterium]